METIYYKTEQSFKEEVRESYDIGRPIIPKVFKSKEKQLELSRY